MQIIEIQLVCSGWQVRGVEGEARGPFFTGPAAIEHAIDDAREGTRHGAGDIRLLARNGEIIAAIPFGPSGVMPPPVALMQSQLFLESVGRY